MTKTYEEILTAMNSRFQELAGFAPDHASDIGIRMKVLAGEIFSMETNLNWIREQMFPQTASGVQLEYHAQQRGVSREAASKAKGVLRFFRYNPIAYDIQIPKGTVCTTAETDGMRYVTLREAVLPKGEKEVTVEAESIEGGEKANAASNTITVMVDPPAGMTHLTNPLPFTGGRDSESDDELRDRLFRSYLSVPNGTNASFYRECALKFEGIHSVSVIPRPRGAGSVDVYVAAVSGNPTSELIAEVQQEMNRLKELNVDVQVKPAELRTVNVEGILVVKSGYVFEEVLESCRRKVLEFFDSLHIGDPFLIAGVGSALYHTEGVKNYKFDTSRTVDINISSTQLAVAGNIAFIQRVGDI